ncbi:MAG: hypothetical protein KR126chlam6_00005 [Candidatus Anoxychlamydiales bacterium]|nr:hypothetical protein [Candidatus Anoxychlamydiales bacterium]
MASSARIGSAVDPSAKRPDLTEGKKDLSEEDDDIKIPTEFVDDVFTLEVMVDPYKIVDCDHGFEKLAIKKHLYFYDRVCPKCRAEISKIVPDEELAKKIQEEFVAISEANKTYFDKIKTALGNDKDYDSVRDKPDMPAKLITREDDLDVDALVEALGDSYPTDAQPIILHAISRGNLTYAEQLNDRMPNAHYHKDFNYKLMIDEYIHLSIVDASFLKKAEKIYDKLTSNSKKSKFHKIFDAYLKTTYLIDAETFLDKAIKAAIVTDTSYYSKIIDIYLSKEFNLTNMQLALKTASKLSNAKTKESYITKITHKISDNKQYIDAFKSAKNISHFVGRLFLYSLVAGSAMSYYLLKIGHGFLYPFRAIRTKKNRSKPKT